MTEPHIFFLKKKKNWRPEFGQSSQNRTQNSFFCHFLKFGSLVFIEITYNDAAIHLEEVKITKIFFGRGGGGGGIWAK